MPLGALWSPPGTRELPLPPETQKTLDDSRRITQEHEKVFYRLAYKSVDDPFKTNSNTRQCDGLTGTSGKSQKEGQEGQDQDGQGQRPLKRPLKRLLKGL